MANKRQIASILNGACPRSNLKPRFSITRNSIWQIKGKLNLLKNIVGMEAHIKNDLLYLLRIIESSCKLKMYAASFSTADEFYRANDQLEYNACLNQLGRIGEQAKK